MLEGITTSNIVQYPLSYPSMTINTSNYTLQPSSSDAINSAVNSVSPLKPVKPPTHGQQPPTLLKKALVAKLEGVVDSNNKKRKRDASVSSASASATTSEKRARISVYTSLASKELKEPKASKASRDAKDARDWRVSKDSKKVSNAHQNRSEYSERSSTPNRGQHSSLGPLSLTERWQPIPRNCVATSSSNIAGSTTTAATTAVLDSLATPVSCYDIVKENLNNFKEYFINYRDPYDQSFKPHYMPYVDLEYPGTGATERFALLSPKDDDAWHPIRELMDAVYAIAKFYLPEENSTLLGDANKSWLPERELKPPAKSKILTPSPTPERQASPPPTSRPIKPEPAQPRSLLRRMEHAYDKQDGVAFQFIIREINQKLRSIKKSSKGNQLATVTEGWNGMPVELVVHIYEETYQRSAGPRVKELLKYQAFSSTTYGELNSGLIAEMCHRAGLKPGVNFLDLGSGIGNVVIQTALLSGCSSAGVEKLESTASIADDVHRVFQQRCALWGVESGPTEVFPGDFMVHTEHLESKIKNADVILANNFVFEPTLNEGLKALFLDLKNGAKIISLRSFCDQQMSRRNMGAIESILDVESFEWRSGDVSWGDAAGRYFISTVNRVKLESQYEKLRKEALELPAKSSRRRK